MRTGAHTKIVIRFWDLQLVEEDIRHLRVIVLAGMDEYLLVLLPELPRDRDALDKLGAGPDNGDDLQVPTSQNPVPILVAAPDTFVNKPLPDKGIRVNDIPAINNNRVFLPAEFFHLRGI